MKILRTLNSGFLALERSLVVLMLSTMVLLAFTQVILRNYFSTGILWADPFLRHLVLWVGFLGASLASQQEKHINIDLITRFVSEKKANLIRIVSNLFAASVCYLLADAGWTFLTNEMPSQTVLFRIGEKEFLVWWFQIIIPIGFGLMMFRFTLRALERMLGAIHPSTPHSAKPTP
jgi:C4-dicarboxylate transporter DctQ subunit